VSTYRNPWHKDTLVDKGSTFSTDKAPILHAGCEIYERIPHCFDVVKAGCCITQRAGMDGAKQCAEIVADLLTPTPDDVRGRMIERYGHA
jgi:HD superfamily phosphohydrolase YqeK